MRVISGKFKGRKINPPKKNYPTRPTTDFARESLFNILANSLDFEEISMLDLFAGFGMNAIEGISRGIKHAVAVDNNRNCIEFIKKVSSDLDLKDQLKIIRMDAFKYIQNDQLKFDLIFADPPYDHYKLSTLPDLVFKNELLNKGGLFVLEHDNNNRFENHPHFDSMRKYGQSVFSFFK